MMQRAIDDVWDEPGAWSCLQERIKFGRLAIKVCGYLIKLFPFTPSPFLGSDYSSIAASTHDPNCSPKSLASATTPRPAAGAVAIHFAGMAAVFTSSDLSFSVGWLLGLPSQSHPHPSTTATEDSTSRPSSSNSFSSADPKFYVSWILGIPTVRTVFESPESTASSATSDGGFVWDSPTESDESCISSGTSCGGDGDGGDGDGGDMDKEEVDATASNTTVDVGNEQDDEEATHANRPEHVCDILEFCDGIGELVDEIVAQEDVRPTEGATSDEGNSDEKTAEGDDQDAEDDNENDAEESTEQNQDDSISGTQSKGKQKKLAKIKRGRREDVRDICELSDEIEQYIDEIKNGASAVKPTPAIEFKGASPARDAWLAQTYWKREDFKSVGELMDMPGLESSKEHMLKLLAELQARKETGRSGAHVPGESLHVALLGNAGTGKSAVATLLAKTMAAAMGDGAGVYETTGVRIEVKDVLGEVNKKVSSCGHCVSISRMPTGAGTCADRLVDPRD
jgi:hypothetical protein